MVGMHDHLTENDVKFAKWIEDKASTAVDAIEGGLVLQGVQERKRTALRVALSRVVLTCRGVLPVHMWPLDE